MKRRGVKVLLSPLKSRFMKNRVNAEFEWRTAPSVDNDGNEDFIIDDSAVAANTKRGVVIITGCSHAGICNIDLAKKVTGESKVHGVAVGCYLSRNHEVLEKIFFLFAELKK